MATYQSVTAGDRIDVGPHTERAHRALDAAVLLHDAGFLPDAVVRAHQSTVHAERALLATEKRSPQSVWSVHRLAVQHFLQPEQLSTEFIDRLEQLALLRQRVDEQPTGSVEAEEAAEGLTTAREFLGAAESWLSGEGYLEETS